MLGTVFSFSSSHLSGRKTSASSPHTFLLLADEVNHKAPRGVLTIDIPVVTGKCKDDVRSRRKRDLADQGPGLRLDGLEQRQHIVLSGPTQNMMHGGVEAKVLLWSSWLAPVHVNGCRLRTFITACRYGIRSRSSVANGAPPRAALADSISFRRRVCTSLCFASSQNMKLIVFDVVS